MSHDNNTHTFSAVVTFDAENRADAEELMECLENNSTEPTLTVDKKSIVHKREPVEIFAEDGEDFQTYCDKDGKKIKAGTSIGHELNGKLILKDGVFYG